MVSVLGQIRPASAPLLAVWHWDLQNTGGGRLTKPCLCASEVWVEEE